MDEQKMSGELETKRLKALLSENKKTLDKIILDFLPSTHHSREIAEMYSMMRDYPSRGGKGLRGTLCLLWCEMFGGRRESAIITAAGLELFQNWILVHDDIEDGSDMRRGSPALHKKVGAELAINVGDSLHGKMWELLLKNSRTIGAQPALDILSEFATMLNETTEGQQIELTWTTRNDWNITEDDYLLMVTKKSAWYTCISPSRMGAIVAATENRRLEINKLLEKLDDLGIDLGISFQIVDDILNLTADESRYGKEILGDIYEGKRTLMLIHLLRNLDPETRNRVISYVSKRREAKTRSEVEFVLEKMKEFGSIDYAREFAKKHSARALSAFDDIRNEFDVRDTEVSNTTRLLLDYLSSRDY